MERIAKRSLMWAVASLAVLISGTTAHAEQRLIEPWPGPADISSRPPETVNFQSRSPFTLADLKEPTSVPETVAVGHLFRPTAAGGEGKRPAVVLLHGAGGVMSARELTYGRQFAAMGIVALVVDGFAARRDRASGFVQRLLEITESMLLADVYAALDYLADMPEVDAERIALIGFSYGGMVTTYAAYAQVAEQLAPDGHRFAGHVAFYAPCIARFADPRATGAPVLMLMGGRDAITDSHRCAEVADELRAGGARVETVTFSGAYHQWDGRLSRPRKVGRNLAPCRFEVDREGQVRDGYTGLPMANPFMRKILLGLCSDTDGYTIGRDDRVRARSNAHLGRFLATIFGAAATP